MSMGDDFLLQVAPDSQQYLKFILSGRQEALPDACASVIDERRVVRGDGHAGNRGAVQKQLIKNLIEEPAVVGVDFGLFLEGDGCGLAVGSFYYANFGVQPREPLHVGLAATKICLDGNTGIAVLSLHFFENSQSSISVGRALHVDFNALLHCRSGRGNFMGQRNAQFAIDEIAAAAAAMQKSIEIDMEGSAY